MSFIGDERNYLKGAVSGNLSSPNSKALQVYPATPRLSVTPPPRRPQNLNPATSTLTRSFECMDSSDVHCTGVAQAGNGVQARSFLVLRSPWSDFHMGVLFLVLLTVLYTWSVGLWVWDLLLWVWRFTFWTVWSSAGLQSASIVSIVVPFLGYLIGSLNYNWLSQKKEVQWRL